ncbi:hypothetical protein F5888DRAFT_1687124 [Russula emetica]|nr:hypothetical protein F5888DRAFT_1687124 [Russula emetica]
MQRQRQAPSATIIAVPTVPVPVPVPRYEEEEEDSDEDVYAPELPPDLAAARANANPISSSSSSSSVPPLLRRPIGPARGPLQQREEEEEESEDEIGPAPPPHSGPSHVHEDAVIDFMQKEAQRRQAIEEAARPKTLKREEWMLVPPSSSGFAQQCATLSLLASSFSTYLQSYFFLIYFLLCNDIMVFNYSFVRSYTALDPTKLNKPRQFSRSTATPKIVDNSLWTETPAEKQQRIADEVMGKKRRVENADLDQEGDEEEVAAAADGAKRRKREAELQRQVEEYTRSHRGPALLEAHAKEEVKHKKDTQEEPAGIWDHSRDMALGGRLMDEKDRRRAIQDAKGLSDRFGAGKGGNFL